MEQCQTVARWLNGACLAVTFLGLIRERLADASLYFCLHGETAYSQIVAQAKHCSAANSTY
jgi:hypothetical protein